MSVDPLRGGAVPLDFHVFLEGLGSYCATVVQQRGYLAQNEGVAFERCRVVRLEVPDVGPDELRLLRGGKSSEALVELTDRAFKPCVHRCP